MPVARWLVVPMLCVGTITAGCGVHVCAGSGCATNKMDQHTVEASLQTATSTLIGANVKSVACPANVAPKKGSSFSCVVTGGDGTVATVLAIWTDNSGSFRLSTLLMRSGALARAIQTQISHKKRIVAHVKCPDLVVVHKGKVFTCRLQENSGRTRELHVRMTNDQGQVHFQIPQG